MPPIYVPSAGPEDWQWLLAQPGLHWKHPHSAFSLAHRWEAADGWPARVREALVSAGMADLEPLVCLPEHQTPLPGGRTASQTDLLVVARRASGLVVIAVEGNYDEPFGERVSEWRTGSTGKEIRLAALLEAIGLSDDQKTGALRYQLLHRTVAALIEARRFGAADAVMLVHSFSGDAHEHLDDFNAFAAVLHAEAGPGHIAQVPRRETPRLHLGWVADEPPAAPAARRLGERFDRAVIFARELHAAQHRKGTEIPYLAHLLGVASLVIDDGGDEDQTIAAVLHDAVEDQGGAPTLRRIAQRFGREVARIVAACSDTDQTPKPPWRQRKEAYIAHLRDPNTDAAVLRVSLADKLHNARAILFDLQAVGPELWSRFSAGRDDQLWYYGALADAFAERDAGPMAAELRRTVDAIASAA